MTHLQSCPSLLFVSVSAYFVATVTACLSVHDAFMMSSGGVSFDVGYEDFLVLDGRKSEDPDGSSDEARYQWTCKDSEGDCFYNNDRVFLPKTDVVNKSVSSFLQSGKT